MAREVRDSTARRSKGGRFGCPLGRGWEAVLLKGADVPTFVSNGAADVGIVGSDILDEVHPTSSNCARRDSDVADSPSRRRWGGSNPTRGP